MDVIPGSSFDTLETCFRLLTSGPAPLTLDGRHVGHGLPARSIPLGELRVLLQHPAATSDLQRAAKHVEADLLELVRDAIRQGPTRAEQLALGVLQLSHLSHPSSPSPLGRKDPLGA